jgi:hypothetical protein
VAGRSGHKGKSFRSAISHPTLLPTGQPGRFESGSPKNTMLILLIILILLFGGGGFIGGGNYRTGGIGIGTILLIVLIVLLLRGGI